MEDSDGWDSQNFHSSTQKNQLEDNLNSEGSYRSKRLKSNYSRNYPNDNFGFSDDSHPNIMVDITLSSGSMPSGLEGSFQLSGDTISGGTSYDSMPVGLDSYCVSDSDNLASQNSDHSDGPPNVIEDVRLSADKDICQEMCDDSTQLMQKALTYMTEKEFQAIDISLKLKLAYFLGLSAHQDLKSVAKNLTSRNSRSVDQVVMTDEIILNNVIVCEILHQFLEGITQKFPRSNDEDFNFAGLHIQACESLIKCVNSKAIGIGSLQKNMQVSQKTSRSTLDPGGTRKVVSSLPLGETIPVREGAGLLVGDNAQRGIGKIQKHSRIKWKRSEACVSVQTHLVVYENGEDQDSSLFKREDVGPSFTDFHPLFRPVSLDFLEVFKLRLKKDEDLGFKIISSMFNTFLSEVIEDVRTGNGDSSISKLSRLNETNCGLNPKVCLKCHSIQNYEPDSQNICVKCFNNPSCYTGSMNDVNPYLRFGLSHGNFKVVESFEQEPLDLNPSSFQSLTELLQFLSKRQEAKGDKISVIGLDGLPGIRIKRLQSDMVKCDYHDKLFKLCDPVEVRKHCKEECIISWPYCDKIVMLGESHEEIFLNLRAAAAASHFGLNDVLEELGRKSKMNKEAAVKTRELNKLFPINLIFIEGSLKMLMSSYVESTWGEDSAVTVTGFINYCLRHTNPRVSSLFLGLYYFMMPALIKRIGLRLHRQDIADAASALGSKI